MDYEKSYTELLSKDAMVTNNCFDEPFWFKWGTCALAVGFLSKTGLLNSKQ